MYFFKPGRARSRASSIASEEECSPQSWRGKKAGGQRDESLLSSLNPGGTQSLEARAVDKSLLSLHLFLLSDLLRQHSHWKHQDPTVPETSPPNLMSRGSSTSLL